MFKIFSFGNDAELLSLPCGCGLWMVAIAKSRLNSAEGNGRAETRDTRHQAKVVTAALHSLAHHHNLRHRRQCRR